MTNIKPELMEAVVYDAYGPPEVLHMVEVEKPVPAANEVLIKLHATTVTSGDLRARTLEMPKGFGPIARLVFGLRSPRQPILGSELAGEIESVGEGVEQFKPGDQVFGFSGAKMGSYAAYKTMPETGLFTLKPANLSFEEAAAISFGGTTALSFLKRGKVKAGEKVLINGASGAVGTAAVQLARHFGTEVTAVCSTANLEMMKTLGADKVIDYTKEDFAKNGETYDIIVDTAGTAPFSRSKDSLKSGGRLLLVLSGLPDLLKSPWASMTTDKKVVAGPVTDLSTEDMRFLAKLAETGEFKPVIDRSYPMEQIVEAHHYVDKGHKKGNVAITIKHS